ncbi:Microtubule-binding calmodulin-regulated spectrin-associated [compost metagenome]
MAGRVNEKEKSEILTILQETDSNEHFVILVRDDKSPVFKALYTIAENTSSSDTNSAQLSQESGMSGMSSTSSTTGVPQNLRKLVGKGPRTLTADMIKAFFRYDSGGKRFIAQPTKTFGVNTDAVVLSDQIARKIVKKKP